jgi:hypothetical protein
MISLGAFGKHCEVPRIASMDSTLLGSDVQPDELDVAYAAHLPSQSDISIV